MSNRIYYANQQVGFKKTKSDNWQIAHGVQSVGISTSFTLEQAFELGQLAIYENIEGIPEIECSITKVLDGHPLLYRLATNGAADNNIVNRANTKCFVAVGIWPDSVLAAGQDGNGPMTQVEMTGMAVTNVSYELSTEGNFTESITLVGDDKAWYAESGPASHTPLCADGAAGIGWDLDEFAGAEGSTELPFGGNNDVPYGTSAQGSGVQRRENFDLGAGKSELPIEVAGQFIQSISVSVDLGRESLFKLGSRKPYARIVNFPAEVSCEIEVLSVSGDQINALSQGCLAPTSEYPCPGMVPNTEDRTITIETCDTTRIELGNKCRLSAVNYGGGDAGGGNSTVTYSYTTYNDFTVTHSMKEPTA